MIAYGFRRKHWDVDVTFAFDGPFAHRLADDNIPTSVIPHRNWLRSDGVIRFLRNTWRETQASRAFRSHYLKHSPDLVYVNTLVSFAAARAACQLGIPVVWHIREMFAEQRGELRWPAGWMKHFVRSVIQRSAARVIVNSCVCRDTVLGANNAGTTVVLPNAVGNQFLVPRRPQGECRRQFGLPETVCVIGVPGTLRPVKGHRFFFRAIEQLSNDFPVHIAVTGPADSDFARNLCKDIQRSPLSTRVSFLGSVDDMVSFYHACDVCCVPSESETFGRTAVEALATETPLVVTAVGGLQEIVQHGRNGLSVESGDVGALVKSLERLSTDRELCRRLTQTGKQDALEKYSEDAYTVLLCEHVERAVSEYRG
jgi:glycosyltransferase involved in cell wall biosynthesis